MFVFVSVTHVSRCGVFQVKFVPFKSDHVLTEERAMYINVNSNCVFDVNHLLRNGLET